MFEFSGNVEFGSVGLTSKDIVVEVWAFSLRSKSCSPALPGAVYALSGGALLDEELDAAVGRFIAANAGRHLVSFVCALTSEFSILADTMRVFKAGY